MNIDAGDLGTIEVNENDIITFEKGILGFGNLKRYVILKGDDQGIFFWLLPVDDTAKRFVLMDTSRFISDYKPITGSEHIAELGDFDDVSDIKIYNFAVIPGNFLDMTVNLKAPVLINKKENKGCQFVCDNDKFPIKYYIQREFQKLKAGE